MRALRVALAALSLCVLATAAPSRASAQAPLPVMNGLWRAGATAINVAVESWGKDCGPEPKSSQSSGGGIVRIDQTGEQLSLHGSGRVVKSDACFGQNPALRRTSKTFKDNTWTTRCETLTTDPRAEQGMYTLKLLTPDRLLYQDVSRFRWELKTSFCVATITTVQTLTRQGDTPPAPTLPDLPTDLETPQPKLTKAQVRAAAAEAKRAAAAAAATTTTPIAKVEPPPCVPGEPKRFAILPRESRIELGGRVCFRPRAFDAAGCSVPSLSPSWSLDHGRALRAKLDARGCFEASGQAAEGEGSFKVAAVLGNLRAESTVEVVTADLSALVAKRLFDADAGAADDAEPTVAAAAPTAADAAELATPEASSRTATRAVGASSTQKGTPSWLWMVAAAVAGILGIAFVLAMRKRSETELPFPPTIQSDSEEKPASGLLLCPTCGATYPAGSAFCGSDGSPLS